MTGEQVAIFAILGVTLALFVTGPIRYDVAAFAALMLATLLGVVPAEDSFSGFAHPAVVTVAAVLILSRALQDSGLLDVAASWLLRWVSGPVSLIVTLTTLSAVISGFMNNVGAMALVMPLALRTAREVGAEPSHVLMPLAFGTVLGGLVTEIGTPPNILIATYRAEVAGAPFGMFDFTPVGVVVAAAGVAFMVLIGWRLVPKGRRGRQAAEDLFKIQDYVSELRVGPESRLIGVEIREVEARSERSIVAVGIIRDDQRLYTNLRMERVKEGDILIVRADPSALKTLVEQSGVDFVGREDFDASYLRSDEVGMIEAVVQPGSRLEGRNAGRLRLRQRFAVNLLAIARSGVTLQARLEDVQLEAGDVLLLHGQTEALPEVVREIGCLPLAPRALRLGAAHRGWVPLAAFAVALAATALGVVELHVAFGVAVVACILGQAITPRAAYDAVDWAVIVMLAAMIPLGDALEDTGGTELIVDGVLALGGALDPVTIMVILMAITMLLSEVLNNAATVVIMAPIGAAIAAQLGVNVDTFLMAVAIGGSCSFLTPIGHQNNILVLGPGGYRFGDFWRPGLPLEVLVLAVATPMLLVVWPL